MEIAALCLLFTTFSRQQFEIQSLDNKINRGYKIRQVLLCIVCYLGLFWCFQIVKIIIAKSYVLVAAKVWVYLTKISIHLSHIKINQKSNVVSQVQ